MRAKRRYITVEIRSAKTNFSKAHIERSVLDTVERIHGVFGLAAVSSFSVKYWNSVTCISLFRIYFGPHKLVTSVLPLVDEIWDSSVIIDTIFVGATLKRCYKNIQNYELSKLEKLWLSLPTKEEKKKYKSCFLDSNIMKIVTENPG